MLSLNFVFWPNVLAAGGNNEVYWVFSPADVALHFSLSLLLVKHLFTEEVGKEVGFTLLLTGSNKSRLNKN